MKKLATLAILAATVGGACRAEKTAPPQPPPSPTATPVATSTAVPDTTGLMATMFTRLSSEAASRPTAGPDVEVVLEALASGGMPTQAGRQVLAATVNARYCWQTTTTDRALGFSVCEYASEADAKTGAEVARVQGAAFGARTIVVRGATMMVMQGGPEPVAKARAIFEKL